MARDYSKFTWFLSQVTQFSRKIHVHVVAELNSQLQTSCVGVLLPYHFVLQLLLRLSG
jgi:hypothetical protein